MIIVDPDDATHSITVYSRDVDDGNVILYIVPQQTTTEDTEVVVGTFNLGLLTFDVTYDFNEGEWYWMKVYNDDSTVLINRSVIFCTATPENYKLTEDYVTPTEVDTGFIVKK